MPTRRRIRTVLYGDQRIEPSELDLLHTPALQRLYELHQLGLADRVFIDASHSRLHHVIGVLHQVENILSAIVGNLDADPRERKLEYREADGSIGTYSGAELANYIRTRRRAARLIGLLHDLTHGPFGHTLEDEIELHPVKHDDPERQAEAFYRLLLQYVGWLAIDSGEPEKVRASTPEAERLRDFLESPIGPVPEPNRSFIDYVARLGSQFLRKEQPYRAHGRSPGPEGLERLLRDLRFAMRGLLWLDALHKDNLDDLLPDPPSASKQKTDPERGEAPRRPHVMPDGTYPFEQLIDSILAKAGLSGILSQDKFLLQRDAFLLDVIGNTICADLLDYARRDAHFAGLRLDYDVDRIVENFTIVSYRRPRRVERHREKYAQLDPILRTAIGIFSHKLRIDVPGELMNLLQVRFYVYQRVLFHPTKCIAGAMLGSALQLVGWRAGTPPSHFRFLGDAVFLHHIQEVVRLARRLLEPYRSVSGTKIESVLDEVSRPLSALPKSVVAEAILELCDARREHEVAEVLKDLNAASRLLNRLSARRFHRPVFRLLPDAAVPELNLDADLIAPVFVDPIRRANAERQIEERCSLPRGSVTIHCPKSDGPKKIAEILILSRRGGRERAFPLREIARIDKDIFQKHQEAITALEEMYKSMWRLVVSVAPPHTQQHMMINKRIGRVLFALLRGEAYEAVYGGHSEEELDAISPPNAVPNDDRMEEELRLAEFSYASTQPPRVELRYPDGRRETWPEPFVEVAGRAARRLQAASKEIEGYVAAGRFAARSPVEISIDSVIEEAIPLRELRSQARGNTIDTGDPNGAAQPQQGELLGGVEETGSDGTA